MIFSEVAAKLHQAAIGAQKRRQKDALIRKYRKPLTTFFQKQKAQVLDQLSQRSYLFTEEYRTLSEDVTQLTLQNWDRIWEEIAQNSDGELQQILASASADGLASGAAQLKNVLPFDSSKKAGTTFNLANPRAVKWFQDNGGSVDKIQGIQATTGDSLKRMISTALDEGWSYTSTAREIQKLYDGPISRDRARVIATTEVGNAYEEGNALFGQSLKDSGINITKRWNTSHDDLVSDDCQANEDEGPIPIDQPHQSGHMQPLAHPRCRCFETYEQGPADD
jgi:hypothetical protein